MSTKITSLPLVDPSGASFVVAGTAQASSVYEETGVGTDTITIEAPASITAPYTFVLPPDAGNSGDVLSTDGIGNTSWLSNAGAFLFEVGAGIDSLKTVNAGNANGDFSVVIGLSSEGVLDDAIAIGHGVSANSIRTIGVGNAISLGGDDAIGIGGTIVSTGVRSIFIGTSSGSNGLEAIGIGTGATPDAPNGIAIGSNTIVNNAHDNSIALGNSATTSDINQLKIGDATVPIDIIATGYITLASYTTAARTALTPPAGAMVFDTDVPGFFGYDGITWAQL